MTIICRLGKPGSCKTAYSVKQMINSPRYVYTNVVFEEHFEGVHTIDISHMIKKDVIHVKQSGPNKGEPVTRLRANTEFWKDEAQKPCDIYLDEAHNLVDSRFSSSSVNKIMSDFFALVRRMTGDTDMPDGGDAIFITQMGRRIDVNIKELANVYEYFISHFKRLCRRCNSTVQLSSESPEKPKFCKRCGYHKYYDVGHVIHIRKFYSYNALLAWTETKNDRLVDNYRIVKNISDYFGVYSTLQWEDMLESLYT